MEEEEIGEHIISKYAPLSYNWIHEFDKACLYLPELWRPLHPDSGTGQRMKFNFWKTFEESQ